MNCRGPKEAAGLWSPRKAPAHCRAGAGSRVIERRKVKIKRRERRNEEAGVLAQIRLFATVFFFLFLCLLFLAQSYA